jgi:hypothetical protein
LNDISRLAYFLSSDPAILACIRTFWVFITEFGAFWFLLIHRQTPFDCNCFSTKKLNNTHD